MNIQTIQRLLKQGDEEFIEYEKLKSTLKHYWYLQQKNRLTEKQSHNMYIVFDKFKPKYQYVKKQYKIRLSPSFLEWLNSIDDLEDEAPEDPA